MRRREGGGEEEVRGEERDKQKGQEPSNQMIKTTLHIASLVTNITPLPSSLLVILFYIS